MTQVDFYAATLKQLVAEGVLRTDMSVLVVCGSSTDREAFVRAGFSNVKITNLDERLLGDEFAPYSWGYQDAENLQLPDGSFDLVAAHAGLHHCGSPHRGLLEMYRVARETILVFEPRDCWMTRAGVRLGFGQDFEVGAVWGYAMTGGGLRNTPVPNYVYRWTEREVEKTVSSFNPVGRHRFRYFHALLLPIALRERRNPARHVLLTLAAPLIKAFRILFPGQCNNFAFAVIKPRLPDDLHAWLEWRDGSAVINREWMQRRFK